jgi:galacturan 1,4-alpha-galacturonidase
MFCSRSLLLVISTLIVLLISIASADITSNELSPAQNGPNVVVGPKRPFKPMPQSTARTKTCEVKEGGGMDDSAAILEAIKECNDGGKVIFKGGAKYTIGTALDLRNLRHIDLVIQGTIQFSTDTAYWQKSAFKYRYQNAASFFALGGTDVNVYGGGTLDGNGHVWEGVFARNKDAIRPILFSVNGMNGGTISDLNMRSSPQWFNLVIDSRNVVYSNIRINGHQKNTDGWDTVSLRPL